MIESLMLEIENRHSNVISAIELGLFGKEKKEILINSEKYWESKKQEIDKEFEDMNAYFEKEKLKFRYTYIG